MTAATQPKPPACLHCAIAQAITAWAMAHSPESQPLSTVLTGIADVAGQIIAGIEQEQGRDINFQYFGEQLAAAIGSYRASGAHPHVATLAPLRRH